MTLRTLTKTLIRAALIFAALIMRILSKPTKISIAKIKASLINALGVWYVAQFLLSNLRDLIDTNSVIQSR